MMKRNMMRAVMAILVIGCLFAGGFSALGLRQAIHVRSPAENTFYGFRERIWRCRPGWPQLFDGGYEDAAE
jgi:hypothetical protein